MNLFARRDSAELEAYFISCEKNLLSDLSRQHYPDWLEAISSQEKLRVLDVGCGIGQTLFLLSTRQEISGIGLDASAQATRRGQEFRDRHLPTADIHFVQGQAESLPFSSASFDIVCCRLSLPYTHNSSSLAEISRVLKSDGLILLKTLHLRYYLRQFRQALMAGKVMPFQHALRVLLGGSYYHLIGRQPHLRWFRETFQTHWLLRKELAKCGLTIIRELPDSTLHTPDFLICKEHCLRQSTQQAGDGLAGG